MPNEIKKSSQEEGFARTTPLTIAPARDHHRVQGTIPPTLKRKFHDPGHQQPQAGGNQDWYGGAWKGTSRITDRKKRKQTNKRKNWRNLYRPLKKIREET